MKNFVEIRYSKTGKYPEISINDELISRYMSLSDYIYDDVFQWADRFFDIIDSELAEEYSVSVIGHPYHAIALESAKGTSEYCEKISFKEIEHRIPISEKYRYACELNELHGAVRKTYDKSITLHCEDKESFEELSLEDACLTDASSEYTVVYEKDVESVNAGKYCIVVSDKDLIRRSKGSVYLYVTRENLPILIDYLNVYHLRMPAIEEIFSALAESSLEPSAKLEFEAYSSEEYRIFISDIPSQMECGDKHKVSFEYFPKCFEEPGLSVVSDNSEILSYENGALVAKGKGNATVRVTDASGKEYLSKKIEITKHNYVTGISIVIPATAMNIGQTLKFRTIISPADAEDIGEVKYTVSDGKVAALTSNDALYALSAGRVCVTVSTPRVSSRVFITVRPHAYGLAVSSEKIELPYGADAMVYCSVIPSNASPMPTVSWMSLNPKVVQIVKSDSGRCFIRAKDVGQAILLCKMDGSDVEKRIEIEVPKTRGCYVATAVYGSYDCPEVWVLRRFRDRFLAKHTLGRLFIKTYYAVSPTAIRLFGKQKWFGKFWKANLDKMVNDLQKKGYEGTPYEDELI